MARYGHLGPAGTFTEEAARRSAPEAELVPYPSVRETVAAVLDGEIDAALVPIENSLEGSVTTTVDALSAESWLLMTSLVVAPEQATNVNDAGELALAHSGPKALGLSSQEPLLLPAPSPAEYESPRAT